VARTHEEITQAAVASGNPKAEAKWGKKKPVGLRILQGIGDLLKGGRGKSATDIAIPEAPDVEGTLRPPGEEAIQAEEDRAAGQLAAEEADKAKADTLAEEVAASRDETTGMIDEQMGSVEEDQARLQENLGAAKEELEEIPEAITSEFEKVRGEFDAQASGAFDRIDAQREGAMADVMEGQGMAAQAAIQGIQGNINNQVAQIQANPNLTAGQKANMIAQTKLAGASSIAPAIGANQLAFNTLASTTATNFANITGNIQAQVLSSQGQLAGMQGEAYGRAKVAVGEMTNRLLEIDATSSAAFANSQANLLGMRSQAELSGNQLLANILPMQGEPWADFTQAANMRFELENGIMDKAFSMMLQSTGMEATIAMIQSMEGSPLKNMLQGALQGMQGGPAGMAMGAVAGWAS
jgi:hypothetical protein